MLILFSNQSNINKSNMMPFRACQLAKVGNGWCWWCGGACALTTRVEEKRNPSCLSVSVLHNGILLFSLVAVLAGSSCDLVCAQGIEVKVLCRNSGELPWQKGEGCLFSASSHCFRGAELEGRAPLQRSWSTRELWGWKQVMPVLGKKELEQSFGLWNLASWLLI